jgi:hypothetical protein
MDSTAALPHRLLPPTLAAATLTILAGAVLLATQARAALVEWQAGAMVIAVETNGTLGRLARSSGGRNLLPPGQPAPLLSLGRVGALHPPDLATWDARAGKLTLRYAKAGVTAVVKVTPRPTHLTLELQALDPADRADVALWGPYPTTIRRTVGEVVGVVRDDEFALGLQALNPKTLGGYPENEEGSADRPYAARATDWGSVLQAYSLDRSRPRAIAVWGKRAPNMPVPPIPGETVVGSKIALFGAAASQALETLGAIEITEGLPHPLIDGIWAKVSPQRGRSYLIADYSEADIDEMLGYVKRAGLVSLYHGNAWKSWGHYEPSPKFFPNGVAGMKGCADKARALGLRLGAHTLSNFIQPQDAYVSPVPDPRLCRTGASELTTAVDTGTTVLGVASPEYFAQQDRNELHTVVIDQELVRYRAVSASAPWQLLDCQRGAFDTRPAPHAKGAVAGKLMDHAYKVFFPNFDLQLEIARNLARRFNETGLSHLDFDGHEGCLAPGQGTYGNETFAREFFDHVDHTVLNGTSPPLSHFYWHINSYCNWGEPWYGGFRDSMQDYRLHNQAFCERNYVPKMLGWYLLTKATCLSDMEWMLARASGFGSGFALATSPSALRTNPDTGRILDSIREWEEARHSGSFAAPEREALRNPKLEFHLERAGAEGWDLYPFHDSPEHTHEAATRQPGEPTGAEWDWTNPDPGQPLQFKLRVAGGGGSITNATFELDRAATCTLPLEVLAGQTLLVESDGIARIYDAKGNPVKAVPLAPKPPSVQGGANHIRFDCEFLGAVPPRVTVTLKTRGLPGHIARQPTAGSPRG